MQLLILFVFLLLPGQLWSATVTGMADDQGQYIIDKIDLTHFPDNRTNFAIAQDENGHLYFANYLNLFKFDGNRISLVAGGQNRHPRSLAHDRKGRLFVGYPGEFGYFTNDESGVMTFNDLTPLVSNQVDTVGNITHIAVRPEGVYFRTSKHIYFWRDQQIMTIIPAKGGRFKHLYVVDDELFVHRTSMGWFKLHSGRLSRALDGAFFKDKVMKALLKIDGKLMAITQRKGVFVLQGQQFVAWKFKGKAENILRKSRIYTAIGLSNGLLALSVEGENKGLWLLDKKGQMVRHMTTKDGLSNDLINVFFEDNQQGLWSGTENGIDRIGVSSPLTYFDEHDQLQGSIRDVARYDGTLYVTTSRGLFQLQSVEQDRVFVNLFDATQDEYRSCFKLLLTKQGLLAACNTSLYQIKKGELIHLDHIATSGMSVMALLPSDDTAQTQVLIGHDGGLGLLIFEAGYWQYRAVAQSTIDTATVEIGIEGPRLIWLLDAPGTVKRLEFQDSLESTPTVQSFDQNSGLPKGFRAFSKVDGQMVFLSNSGVYRFDGDSSRFVIHDGFAKFAGHRVIGLNESSQYVSLIENVSPERSEGVST